MTDLPVARFRRSHTPGYQYDVWDVVESWSADEYVLTRTGSVHLCGSGALYGWRPLHSLNDPDLYAAARAEVAT